MRLLVAGGAGFIGSHLVDRLLQREDCLELLVADNFWTGRRSTLSHITDARLRIVESNVESTGDMGHFEEIYHLASPASPPWYMNEPLRTIKANVLGALRLLEL